MVRITIFALTLKKVRLRKSQGITLGHGCLSHIPPLGAPSIPQRHGLVIRNVRCLPGSHCPRHSSFSGRNLHMGVKERRIVREKLSVHVTKLFFFFPLLSQGRWWWWESYLTHPSSHCMWDLAQALKPCGKRFIHQVPHLLERLSLEMRIMEESRVISWDE